MEEAGNIMGDYFKSNVKKPKTKRKRKKSKVPEEEVWSPPSESSICKEPE